MFSTHTKVKLSWPGVKVDFAALKEIIPTAMKEMDLTFFWFSPSIRGAYVVDFEVRNSQVSSKGKGRIFSLCLKTTPGTWISSA